MWERLILVCGHRRSGSSWLAAAIGRSGEVQQIPYEPLWLKWHPGSPYAERIREWRTGGGWYFGWDPASASDAEAAHALHSHLEWLCSEYFEGPVGDLLIKEPHPNWLEFLVAAFRPDQVVYLQRHPLGIVNSYDKAGLYLGWQVDEEWQAFCRQLPALLPELVPLSRQARHPAERVAFMARACDLLQEKVLAGRASRVVSYEALGLQPQERFQDLFEWLGLPWGAETWERLRPLVEPRQYEMETGFRFVKKRSQARVYAWRRELPRHLVLRVGRLLKSIDAGYPLPGDGLPALTARETASGWATYLQRRRAYLRKHGWRAVLPSL
jgi:hypothetical protein